MTSEVVVRSFEEQEKLGLSELKGRLFCVMAGGGGTDLGSMMKAGVIGSGVRTVGKRYFEWHRSESDTLNKLNPDDFRRNPSQLAVFDYVLADMDLMLGN